MSKAGYGKPEEILNSDTELMVSALEYEVFLKDYETAFLELNKDSK